jgi:hypothetical protein
VCIPITLLQGCSLLLAVLLAPLLLLLLPSKAGGHQLLVLGSKMHSLQSFRLCNAEVHREM